MGMKIWETGSNRQINLVRTKKKKNTLFDVQTLLIWGEKKLPFRSI